jgi:hypothetical protein
MVLCCQAVKNLPKGVTMKKFIIVIALAAILATGTAFATPDGFGIGVIGGGGYGWGGFGGAFGATLSLYIPGVPVYWGVSFSGGWGFGIGLSADFWHIIDNKPLVPDIGLSWFIRGGAYGKFFSSFWWGLEFGVRVPIGLSWKPTDLIELFFDIVPSIGIGIWPGFYMPVRFGGGIDGELGIRFWF